MSNRRSCRIEPLEGRLLLAADVDPTFGIQVTTDFNLGQDIARAMTLQPDGKIVLVGESSGDFGISRYNPDGSLDTSFDGDGRVTTDFGFNDRAYGVAIQPDGKIVVVGRGDLQFAVARYNPDGSLDTSFDGDGKETIRFRPGNGDEAAYEVAVQSDGKLIVGGTSYEFSSDPSRPGYGDNAAGGDHDFALARLNADGSLDSTYGVGGKVTTDFNNHSKDEAYSLVLQPDGKVVLAGFSNNSNALARYNADGSLDATWGSGGKVTVNQPNGFFSVINDIDIQADGKIVTTGTAFTQLADGHNDFFVNRFNTNGSLDASFGTGGWTLTDFNNGSNDDPFDIKVDGAALLVAGLSGTGGTVNFALASYTSNGALDPSFGNGGKVVSPSANPVSISWGAAVQPDGRILVAGETGTNPVVFVPSDDPFSDFALARYNADGSPDTTFGTSHAVVPDFVAEAAASQPDGKFVTAGHAIDPATGRSVFVVSRTTPDGAPDLTFGDPQGTQRRGRTSTDFGVDASAFSLAIDASGRIVLAGTAAGDFALARYNADGTLDSSFGNSGKLTTDLGTSADAASFVATDPNGRLVAAGSTEGAVAVVRYGADGSRDTSFNTSGAVIADLGPASDSVAGLVAMSDGRVLLAENDATNIYLARYNPDGSADATLNGSGSLATGLAPVSSRDRVGLAVQSDGRVLVAGRTRSGVSTSDFKVQRYNPDGSPDLTFGADATGVVTADFGGDDDADSLTLRPSGRFVVTGTSTIAQQPYVAVASYTSDGRLDPTFGTSGLDLIETGVPQSTISRAVLAPQYLLNIFSTLAPDERLIVGSTAQSLLRQAGRSFLRRLLTATSGTPTTNPTPVPPPPVPVVNPTNPSPPDTGGTPTPIDTTPPAVEPTTLGTFAGKATFTATDAAGHVVLFSLKGPGTGTVLRDGNDLSVTVTGASNSKLTLATLGPATVKDVRVDGTLKQLTAKMIDLTGTLSAAAIEKVMLGSISGGAVAAPVLPSIQLQGAANMARILAGTSVGGDGLLGTADDVSSAAVIKSLKIGGPVTTSTISAGGGAIRSITTGGLDDSTRFIAVSFPKKARIGGTKLAPATDSHFVNA